MLAYEMEPQCVAKTMVMIEMLKDPNTVPRMVVEVWLSSLWSKSTVRAFKEATKKVLTKTDQNMDDAIDSRVLAIIKYWNGLKAMSVKAAIDYQCRAVFEKMEPKFAMESCCLVSETDRVDYLRYFLTKAFYEDETTTVGSLVMNSEKQAIGVKQLFENCIEAVPCSVHMPMNRHFKTGLSFMERSKAYFENKMETFGNLIRDGVINFKPKLSTVSLDNETLVKEVHRANPYIISWSNVVDYIEPNKFHKVARRMSGPDTVHYMHSCNWTTRVYGTDVFDINEKSRLFVYSGGLLSIQNSLGTCFTGLSKLGVYHFRDICTVVLARKFVKNFFRFFFDGQEVNCGCMNGETPLKLPFPFSRNVGTAFVAFAYKETGVTFETDSYDYSFLSAEGLESNSRCIRIFPC